MTGVYATLPSQERRGLWACELVLGERRDRLEATTKAALLDLAERRQRGLGARVGVAGLTAGGAIAAFVGARQRQGAWAPETLERMRDDLHGFVAALRGGPACAAAAIDRNAVRRYLRRLERQGVALGSQRSRFAAVAGWLHYLHCEGVLAENPAQLVHATQKPWTGKRARRQMGRGKPQLQGAGQARAYLEAALAHDDAVDRVAAALPLLAGLRSGEVRHLRVADVDAELRALWIRGDHAVGAGGWDVKTAASTRTVPIPDELAGDIAGLCRGRATSSALLASRRSADGCFEAAWLRRLVQRTCVAAGVRVVSPHGLRGTYVSICAALARLEAPKIAQLVGHADQGTTVRRAYLGAPEHRPGLRLVAGGG